MGAISYVQNINITASEKERREREIERRIYKKKNAVQNYLHFKIFRFADVFHMAQTRFVSKICGPPMKKAMGRFWDSQRSKQ